MEIRLGLAVKAQYSIICHRNDDCNRVVRSRFVTKVGAGRGEFETIQAQHRRTSDSVIGVMTAMAKYVHAS